MCDHRNIQNSLYTSSGYTGRGNGIVTQFKNLINAREARLGCGITIKRGDGAYVVAHYSLEPGKQFQLNDFSPAKDVRPRKEVGKTLRLTNLIVFL